MLYRIVPTVGSNSLEQRPLDSAACFAMRQTAARLEAVPNRREP
jgi:hypothetical protein